MLKPLALHISERKNNEENIFGPPKENRKKCLLKSKLLQNRLCVFFRQNFSSHLHLKIFKKKIFAPETRLFFFKERETNFLSKKKKLWEAHEKLRFFRQNFLKNQLSWIFLTCIPSSIAKPNRICTHKKIHLDFAYYSKNCNVYLEKKIIAFFSRIFNHIG